MSAAKLSAAYQALAALLMLAIPALVATVIQLQTRAAVQAKEVARLQRDLVEIQQSARAAHRAHWKRLAGLEATTSSEVSKNRASIEALRRCSGRRVAACATQ